MEETEEGETEQSAADVLALLAKSSLLSPPGLNAKPGGTMSAKG